MNIFKRIENNLKYAKYRKQMKSTLVQMQKHASDEDGAVFMLLTLSYLDYMTKSINIPLK